MSTADRPLSMYGPTADDEPPSAPHRLAVAVSCGNRCGHDPRAPRLFEPPPGHRRHPLILLKLIGVIVGYYHTPSLLPSLNLANDADRQQRSERREACLALLGVLIYYLDLASLRVGLPQPEGSFKGLAMVFLAAQAGLALRRAERAMRDLKAAGLIEIYPIAEQHTSGEFSGLPAIRRVSPLLFKVFGLHRWLAHERAKAASRRRKLQCRAERSSEEALARLELSVKAASLKAPRPVDTPAAELSPVTDRKTLARTHMAQARALLRGERAPPG